MRGGPERSDHVQLHQVALCLPDVIAHDQISQAFSSVFAYCKPSNTGDGNSLGMRLGQFCSMEEHTFFG